MSDKQNKVILLTSGAGANADPKALQNAVKKHNFYRKAWFERRSLCMDAVDLLCEGLGKKKSELLVSQVSYNESSNVDS